MNGTGIATLRGEGQGIKKESELTNLGYSSSSRNKVILAD